MHEGCCLRIRVIFTSAVHLSLARPNLSKKLIEYKELMFDIPPQQIVWCYKEWQTAYSQLQEREKIKFLRGIPDQDEDLVTDTGETYLLFSTILWDKTRMKKNQIVVYSKRTPQKCECRVYHSESSSTE